MVCSRESATISWLLIAALVSMLMAWEPRAVWAGRRRPRPSGRWCAILPRRRAPTLVNRSWRAVSGSGGGDISAMLSEMSRIPSASSPASTSSRMNTTARTIAVTMARAMLILQHHALDPPAEEGLDREVGPDQDDDRQERRQDPEPDDDRERGDQQADAQGGPRLPEGPSLGDDRRLRLGRMTEVRPRVLHPARLELADAAAGGIDRPGRLDRLQAQLAEAGLVGGEFRGPGRGVSLEARRLAQGGDLLLEGRHAVGETLGFDDRGVPFGGQLDDPGLEDADPLRRRRHLLQAGEPERVVPGLADRTRSSCISVRPGRARRRTGRPCRDPTARGSRRPSRRRRRSGWASSGCSVPGPTATPSPRA